VIGNGIVEVKATMLLIRYTQIRARTTRPHGQRYAGKMVPARSLHSYASLAFRDARPRRANMGRVVPLE